MQEELKEGWEHCGWLGNMKDQLSSIVVHIRNNQTGVVVDYVTNSWWGDQEPSHPNVSIWEEGNYACDCNRSLFFYDWSEDVEDCSCGEEAFSVNISNPVDGVIFYREYE